MSKRRRLTGSERRELKRRSREKLGWARQDGLLLGAGVLTAALVGLAVVLLVFGDGGEETPPLTLASPTAPPGLTPTAAPAGPPPLEGEPTFTDSGLGVIDIEEGTGATPEPGQTLVVHYTGWLEDGTQFDTSLDDGVPFEFLFGAQPPKVIAGWEEGLATMKEGGKRRLIIPPALAYGEAGRPGIPPNAQLTFDVELVEIKDTP
jgi:peptidylprolyl isomerase